MSIALVGASSSYEFRWRRWALLRDVVRAHLDTDAMRFPRFLGICDVLGQGTLRISAAALAHEVQEIGELLAQRPITDLVIGPHTAAVIYPGAQLTRSRPLTAAELQQVAPVGAVATLVDYFSSMLESIREVCASPLEDGLIEVVDG